MKEEEKKILEANPKKLFWINLFYNLSALTSVITLFYLHRGLNFTQIAVLSSIISLTIILFEIPTGMIADIVGRKKSIILGMLLLIVYGTIYIFAYNFIVFIIGVMFFAISMTFFSGTIIAIIYDSLKAAGKENQAKKHIGRYRSASLLGAIFIPPIASIIAKDLLNWQFIILLLINIVGYLIALFLAFTLHEAPYAREKNMKKFKLLKESFGQIISNVSLIKLSFNQGIGFVCVLIFGDLLWQPYFQQAKVSVVFFGSIFAFSNAISFFLFRNVDKIEKTFGLKSTIFFTSFLPGIFFVLMTIFLNPLLAIMSFLIINLLLPLRDPLFSDYKNQHIKSHTRATTISIIALFYSLLAIILQPIIGFLADINLIYAFLVLGIILLINPILFKIKEEDILIK